MSVAMAMFVVCDGRVVSSVVEVLRGPVHCGKYVINVYRGAKKRKSKTRLE